MKEIREAADAAERALDIVDRLDRKDALRIYPDVSLDSVRRRLEDVIAFFEMIEDSGSYISGDQPTRIEKVEEMADKLQTQAAGLDLEVADRFEGEANRVRKLVTEIRKNTMILKRKEGEGKIACDGCGRRFSVYT